MNESRTNDFRPVVLSHEEFTYLLGLLAAQPTLGVDTHPLRGLDDEQLQIALRTARHSLQARGLVHVSPGGETEVENSLLDMLGSCAYPERLLTVYHWDSGAELPAVLLVYHRGNNVILHLRPEPALHELIRVPEEEMATDAIVRFCAIVDTGKAQDREFGMAQEDFLALRSLTRQGNIAAAESLMAAKGYAEVDAKDVLSTLQAQPRVSAISAFYRNGSSAVQQSAFTLLQSQQASWLLVVDESTNYISLELTDLRAIRALLSAAL